MSGNGILTWSYSRWAMYQDCPAKLKYVAIEKRKSPQSKAMDRGIDVHKEAEDYLKGERDDITANLKYVAEPLRFLREHGAVAEGETALTATWNPTGYWSSDVWLRVKLDAKLDLGSVYAVVDWKTGKKYDDHPEQLSLYAVTALEEKPKARRVIVQDWYTDMSKDNVLHHEYTRQDLEPLKKDWLRKTKAMFSDTKFAPRPAPRCGWCPFSKKNGGPCAF